MLISNFVACQGYHIRKHQDIKTLSDDALSRSHFKICSKVVENFNDSKAQQQPAGVLDTTNGEYKDYFVWAGEHTKDVPDASEPGIVEMVCMIFTHFCSNFINY